MSFTPVADPVITHDLIKPIQYLGQAISTLYLREPIGFDQMNAGGAPVSVDPMDMSKVTFHDERCFKMIAILTGLPVAGTLDRMNCNDVALLFWKIAPFFLPMVKLPSSEHGI